MVFDDNESPGLPFNIPSLHKLLKHSFIDQSARCLSTILSALQTIPAWPLLSHQTSPQDTVRERELEQIVYYASGLRGLGHVETSFLSHDCSFVRLCLAALCLCPRTQGGAYNASLHSCYFCITDLVLRKISIRPCFYFILFYFILLLK